MKLAVALLPLLLSVPAQATVTRYQWEGTVDRGADLSTQVRGDFLYDSDAPTFQDGDGNLLHEGSIKSVNLFIGNDHYQSTFPWFSTVAPIPSFSDLNLNGPTIQGNAHGWATDNWYITLYEYQSEGWFDLKEIGGKVVSFWTDGGYVPDLPGRDAEPVPEPSSLVLMASGLAAYGLFRRKRIVRR